MKILQSRSDRGTHSKTFRHWKLRTFSMAVATSQSEYFTEKHVMKKLICCLSWSSGEDCSADLVPEMSRPQLHIFHSYVWCDIKCTKQCRLKLFSNARRRTGPVSSRQSNELDRIDPYFFIRYFFGWLADFLVGDAPECRVQQYFYLEVRIVFVNILHT